MTTLFEAVDRDGDRVIVTPIAARATCATDYSHYIAAVEAVSREGRASMAYLTAENVAELRATLAQIALYAAEDGEDEPDEDPAGDPAYEDGYADGYAAGVLDSAELPKPLSHEQALEKAVELIRQSRCHGLLGGPVTVEQLLGLAAYLRGDLPMPTP